MALKKIVKKIHKVNTMKKVFEEVNYRSLHMRNRLVRSATWEGIASADGSIFDEAYEIYDELSSGGVGAIITGFTSVSSDDHYFGGMMRLSDDALVPQYKKLTEIIHSHGVPVITQLALGTYYRPATDGSFRQTEPDRMTLDEVRHVRDQFIDAAVRAEKSGFDGVQIHVAHFFFLSRFVSPAVNHRTDEYGGSTASRARLVIEIINGIKRKAPGLHITSKINSNDFTYGGLDESESLEMCRLLCEAGLDSIEVSGNGTSVGGIRPHVNEGYFVPFAARLAEGVDTPVIAVGGFRSLDVMGDVLNKTKIEMISLSRPLLREPDLPNLMKDSISTISSCVSCNACYSSPSHKCVFRGRD